jgi:hypothetical protein
MRFLQQRGRRLSRTTLLQSEDKEGDVKAPTGIRGRVCYMSSMRVERVEASTRASQGLSRLSGSQLAAQEKTRLYGQGQWGPAPMGAQDQGSGTAVEAVESSAGRCRSTVRKRAREGPKGPKEPQRALGHDSRRRAVRACH